MSSLSNLNDYWRLHSDELAERILASYPPLHGLDDAPSPALSQMLRTPYPAQSLAIMGVAKRWRSSRGAHVVAECGAGKTLIALGMMFVHAQGQPFSGIVMAPPHLVEKWARETFLTLPRVRVFLIDDMRNGGDPRQPHGVNEVRLRRGEIVREGLHTTLADLRMLGPKGWRKVCPESSIFVFGRERAKLGYFWKHVYLKGRAGKHLGLVLNPDTSKPISTDDEFLDVRDFDKKRLHEFVERDKGGTAYYSALWQADATRSSAWRQLTSWAATCPSGSITPSPTRCTSSPATRLKATLSVCWQEWPGKSPASPARS